jgi:hypothetical protein
LKVGEVPEPRFRIVDAEISERCTAGDQMYLRVDVVNEGDLGYTFTVRAVDDAGSGLVSQQWFLDPGGSRSLQFLTSCPSSPGRRSVRVQVFNGYTGRVDDERVLYVDVKPRPRPLFKLVDYPKRLESPVTTPVEVPVRVRNVGDGEGYVVVSVYGATARGTVDVLWHAMSVGVVPPGGEVALRLLVPPPAGGGEVNYRLVVESVPVPALPGEYPYNSDEAAFTVYWIPVAGAEGSQQPAPKPTEPELRVREAPAAEPRVSVGGSQLWAQRALRGGRAPTPPPANLPRPITFPWEREEGTKKSRFRAVTG